MKQSRRQFIRTSALTGLALVVPYHFSTGAEEKRPRLRIGVIGLGGQGLGNAYAISSLADIVAISDVAPDYKVAGVMNKKTLGIKKNDTVILPDFYPDYRKLLERQDIDAVIVATPDHWHTKISIEAMQSGKHVYCQKPLTLTLEESALIRRAVEKYGKVFQVGTQRRTQVNEFALATLITRGGYLGKVHRIVCVINPGRESGPLQKFPIPFKMDWDKFVGQAPMVDYIASSQGPGKLWGSNNLPDQSNGVLTFRWWHNFAGGKITDWGAHYVDGALWAVDREKKGDGPVRIDGSGSRFLVPYKNGFPTVDNIYNTAVDFNIKCTYADGFELIVTSKAPSGDGVFIEGDKSRIHINCDRMKGKLIEEGIKSQFTKKDYEALFNGKPVENHWQNFVRCCIEGGTPISDVASHVQAVNVCHLCGIASRVNREIQWDPVAEKIVGDELAASFYSYKQRKGYELPTLN